VILFVVLFICWNVFPVESFTGLFATFGKKGRLMVLDKGEDGARGVGEEGGTFLES